jgi:DNA-binding CsgD family transcriptional regulator
MKQIVFLAFFGNLFFLNAQYQFSGQVPEDKANKSVYLSLIENYRKSSRVYSNQIIKETKTDNSGHFTFEGDNLSSENRIYRIHIDGCEEDGNGGGHFLKDCNNTQSILFIAQKNDTISFPLLQNNQALCEVSSTNNKSGLLLEIDALKEEMILDFLEYDSEANESLNFKKWFNTFQEYGEKNKEPLADLYIYDFLSDRASETHSYYITDVQNNPYYDSLAQRLVKNYKNSSFTNQYFKELLADKTISEIKTEESSSLGFIKITSILLLVIYIAFRLFKYKSKFRRSSSKSQTELTPQEGRVYKAIQNNKTNKEIAAELFISVSTVKTHINSIYKKLNITSRKEITKNQPGV